MSPASTAQLDPEIAALLLPVPGTSPTFAARVFSYVDASGDCWEWTGTLNEDGYGVIGRGRRGAGNLPAHVAVYLLLAGEIKPGLHLDHLCRNHSCVNPDHLEPVTPGENKRRGYSAAVLYAKREVCDNGGHPLDGVLGGRGGRAGHRYCKTCARERQNALYVPHPQEPVTQCANGHDYTPENTYTDPKRGHRQCKACRLDRQRASREAAKKAAA